MRHFLRNVIYNRDDDIFELKPKSPEELERIQKEKEEREKELKEIDKNKISSKNEIMTETNNIIKMNIKNENKNRILEISNPSNLNPEKGIQSNINEELEEKDNIQNTKRSQNNSKIESEEKDININNEKEKEKEEMELKSEENKKNIMKN